MPIVGTSNVIVQLTPVSDTVGSSSSESYQNQLATAGNQSLVSYTVTNNPSAAFSVSSTGAITTTGVLSVGTYVVSGTDADLSGNVGVWAFTLTVTGSLAPAAIVTPAAPTLPTGIEMLVPFQIDPATGGTAFIVDYSTIMAQHILTIIMTAQQERVMLPQYGFGIENLVFSNIYDIANTITAADIQNEITKWESAVNVQSVTVNPSTTAPNILDVVVTYSVNPYTKLNQVSVAVGGAITQVIAP
jgi:phage baseplate assembly protein W